MPTDVTNNFPLKELPSWRHNTKVTYKNFIALERDVYACASSVPSTAGGGNHGCLGQVMPTDDYLTLAGEAYVRPEHPGELDLPARANYNEQWRYTEERKEQKARAEQARDLEHALKRMIVQAVPERYLAVLRNHQTGAYENHSVRQILTHLRSTVAKMTDEELQEEYDSIAATTFDPDGMEVTEVLAKIRDLGRLAATIDNPYTDTQLINLAIKIFTNCDHFTQGIRAWKARPAAERTMDNLHHHFVTEQATLRELHPQGIGAVMGQHLNILRDSTNRQQYFEAKTQELLEIVDAMRQQQNTMRQEQANFIANVSTDSTASDKPKKKKKKKKKEEYQQEGNENNPCKYYCWIHGCNDTHPSYVCYKGLNDKENYPKFRADATFTNRMGGKWKGAFGS